MTIQDITNIRKSLFSRVLHSKMWVENFIVWHDEEKNILLEALEKQIPKKPTHLHHCPNCGTGISIPPVVREEYKPFAVYPRFCRDCGQAIDWSDTE